VDLAGKTHEENRLPDMTTIQVIASPRVPSETTVQMVWLQGSTIICRL